MNIERIKVSPYVAEGAISSLLGLAPASQVQISGNGPSKLPASPPFSSLDSMVISASAAIDLGFANLVNVSSKVDTTYILGEFVVEADPVPGRAGGIVRREFYGVGYRLCVKAWNISADVKASLTGITAESTIGAAKSVYELQFLGLSLAAMEGVGPFIAGNVGKFDASAMARLGALEAQLRHTILSAEANITPVLLGVEVDWDAAGMPFRRAFSTSYALQSITSKGRTLEQALAAVPGALHYGGAIDVEVVKAVYAEWVQGAGAPSSDAKKAAAQALFWGE